GVGVAGAASGSARTRRGVEAGEHHHRLHRPGGRELHGRGVTVVSSMCPSAQPDMAGCQVLGVIGGTGDAPRVAYVDEPLLASAEVLALAGPIGPTRVLRLAAACEESACTHFDGND